MPDNIKLEDAIEFAENPEPRCPCVLLLDTSGSMSGEPIAALNQGLQVFKEQLVKDPMACRRVEVAVVTFDNEIKLAHDFTTAERFEPPRLTAQGQTFMGGAIHKALDMIQARKQQYRANGVAYYRPWVFMITDGEPQGEPESIVEAAAQRLKNDEAAKRVAFFAVSSSRASTSPKCSSGSPAAWNPWPTRAPMNRSPCPRPAGARSEPRPPPAAPGPAAGAARARPGPHRA
jgi:uncharacterized protein YegL